jgi:hypothetical protein
VVLAIVLAPSGARAQDEGVDHRADAASVSAEARQVYQGAMGQSDPTRRQKGFADAESMLGVAVEDAPDRPELLADWGNAALGAGDFGTATLAYRRALLADAQNERARKNLAWLRTRLPDNLRPREGGAAARLLFYQSWSPALRLIVGAAFFAIAIALLVPWRRRPGIGRILLAVLAANTWIALTVSVLLASDRASDGVVLDAQVLRSADAPGAPAAQAAPIPPGAEVTILERRPGWTRIRTAGGLTGWLPDEAVAAVRP